MKEFKFNSVFNLLMPYKYKSVKSAQYCHSGSQSGTVVAFCAPLFLTGFKMRAIARRLSKMAQKCAPLRAKYLTKLHFQRPNEVFECF